MITPEYCQTMARYNAWQNQSLYAAAAGLDDAAREADRGAFWGSIRKTLAHLVWGDLIWIARFDGGPAPEAAPDAAPEQYGWDRIRQVRPQLDARISAWAWSVADEDLAGDLTWYSGFFGRDMTRSRALCVMQIFNHQTHHRGQVHAMLTAAGARPDDTDLQLLPDEVPEWT